MLFIFTSTIFGILFIFLVPPINNIDEPSHFYRAYQLSEGKIIGQKISNEKRLSGGKLPSGLTTLWNDYGYIRNETQAKTTIKNIKDSFIKKIDLNNRSNIEFNNTVVYPPLSYAPQAIGILLARCIYPSTLLMLYTGRLFNLIFWIICIYFSIKLLPVGKWVLFVLALFPMTLTLSTSLSADGPILAMSSLLISIILHIILEIKMISNRQLILLTIPILALSMMKLPYAALGLFFFAIPKEKFPKKFPKYTYITILGATTISLIAIWQILSSKTHVELLPYTSVPGQIHTMLTQPLIFIRALLMIPFEGRLDGTFIQFFGTMGWADVNFPLWLVFWGYLSLILSILLIKEPFSRKIRITSFSTLSVVVIATVASIYITWLPPGKEFVDTLWGRYFIPESLLLISCIGGIFKLDNESRKNAKIFIAISMPMILCFVSYFVYFRFYVK